MTGAYCKVDLADCQSQRELAILASPELPHDEYLESIASDGEPSPVYEAVQHPFPPLLLDTSVNELSKGPSEDVEVQEAAQQLQSKRQFAKEMAFVTIPSLLLSMVGSVLAGEVLTRFKTWPVFMQVEELFILVPILLNLKGNLEMNLAARLSTSANFGELDFKQTRQTILLGNMALMQAQTLLAALLAGLVAFGLGAVSGIPHTSVAAEAGKVQPHGGYFEFAMVLCASMLAAGLSSAVVSSCMFTAIVLSRAHGIDPDNLATPLAASLSDLVSLVLLALVASEEILVFGTLWSTGIVVALFIFIAVNIRFSVNNPYVRELIWQGWVPLLLSLAISSGTGIVLESSVNEFRAFGLLAPVVTGIAGNAGSVLVSRLSTALKREQRERYWLTASSLFVISLAILLGFLGFVFATRQLGASSAFAATYSLATCFVTAASLGLAYMLTTWLWSRGYDPDINALPLLCSAVDLSGQSLLMGAYLLANVLGASGLKLRKPAKRV